MGNPRKRQGWLHRCKCGACGAVLWTDAPMATVCVCGGAGFDADGVPFGDHEESTDRELEAFWLKDAGEALDFFQIKG